MRLFMIVPPFSLVCIPSPNKNQLKICIDMAGDVPYNPQIMDSLNVLQIPTEALSSLLSWNWWAASPAR
jgi:hypothetical protein